MLPLPRATVLTGYASSRPATCVDVVLHLNRPKGACNKTRFTRILRGREARAGHSVEESQAGRRRRHCGTAGGASHRRSIPGQAGRRARRALEPAGVCIMSTCAPYSRVQWGSCTALLVGSPWPPAPNSGQRVKSMRPGAPHATLGQAGAVPFTEVLVVPAQLRRRPQGTTSPLY